MKELPIKPGDEFIGSNVKLRVDSILIGAEGIRGINTFIGHVSGGKEGPRHFASVLKLRQFVGSAEVISRGQP